MFVLALLDLWTPWKGRGSKIFRLSSLSPLQKQSGSCLLIPGSSTTVFLDRSSVPLSRRITEQLRLEGNSESHLLQGAFTSQLDQVSQSCVQLVSEHLQGWKIPLCLSLCPVVSQRLPWLCCCAGSDAPSSCLSFTAAGNAADFLRAPQTLLGTTLEEGVREAQAFS